MPAPTMAASYMTRFRSRPRNAATGTKNRTGARKDNRERKSHQEIWIGLVLPQNPIPASLVVGNLLGRGHLAEIGLAVCFFRGALSGLLLTSAAIPTRTSRLRLGRLLRNADYLSIAAVAHHVRLQLQIVFKRAMGLDA